MRSDGLLQQACDALVAKVHVIALVPPERLPFQANHPQSQSRE
jgi:hypothetical protein